MHKFQVSVNVMSTVPRFQISRDSVRSGPLVACVLERHDSRKLAIFPKNLFSKQFYLNFLSYQLTLMSEL